MQYYFSQEFLLYSLLKFFIVNSAQIYHLFLVQKKIQFSNFFLISNQPLSYYIKISIIDQRNKFQVIILILVCLRVINFVGNYYIKLYNIKEQNQKGNCKNLKMNMQIAQKHLKWIILFERSLKILLIIKNLIKINNNS